MDNQHRQIKGYKELGPVEIDLINQVKEMGAKLDSLLKSLEVSGADPRWLAIGKTDLQKGLMSVTRSIAKPEFF